jgi:hypothetical protein
MVGDPSHGLHGFQQTFYATPLIGNGFYLQQVATYTGVLYTPQCGQAHLSLPRRAPIVKRPPRRGTCEEQTMKTVYLDQCFSSALFPITLSAVHTSCRLCTFSVGLHAIQDQPVTGEEIRRMGRRLETRL